jgi:F0F1-type ATP synthase membrane subunit b/b'
VDILYLVDRLENLIASSRRMPLVNQIIIKEADILSIVDQMRTSIPDEIKQARRIIQEKERILAQAQAEATALRERARAETDQAMKREGLLRAADERSQELLRHAEAEAERLKDDAYAYVGETLRALRDHLGSIEMEVSRTILSIEKGLESLESGLEEEGVEEESEEHLYDQQAEGTPPSARPVPRRASLAADTLGGPIFPPDSIQGPADR